jgi:hypothetical protein
MQLLKKARINSMKERSSIAKKMSYLFLFISLIILASLIYFKFIRSMQEVKEYAFHTKLNTASNFGLVEHPSPRNFDRGRIVVLPTYDPNLDKQRQVDLRSTDISGIDVSRRLNDLLYADFDDKTRWPAKLPEGFSPAKIMELGKNPGLGIQQLHSQGITGKGIGLAIIDQPLLVDHIEYKDNLRLYEEIHIDSDKASMHGPAVASIAVGKNVGVAPEADLYYIAEWHGYNTEKGFQWDFSYLVQSIERILEINKNLPNEKKIRVISISVGWTPEQKGYKQMMAVVEKAIREGVFIVSSSIRNYYDHKYIFSGLGRSPNADPDQFTSYSPGIFWMKKLDSIAKQENNGNTLLVPMDSRCTASPTGINDYVFYREGGWSWSIPYIAGLYVLACQVDKDITPELFWQTALATAEPVNFERDSHNYNVGKIVNPIKLILVLSKNRAT